MKYNSTTYTWIIILIISSFFFSAEAQTTPKYELYGFIRNDFYYNSRQNVEVIDGFFHIFPKLAINDVYGNDINQVAQSEMISVASRLGLNINGPELFKARSTAKIEMDFCGSGSTYFLIRLRQAYMKLNWKNTELLAGQTWHPLFGNVVPTTLSLNSGSPFQPFNRSPQLRVKQNLTSSLSVSLAGIYQMQYTSYGPEGKSNIYMKQAMLPNIYLGLENSGKHFTGGIGLDYKTLKINKSMLASKSAMIYGQYANKKLQIKAKSLIGQNLSDFLMPMGYGLSDYNADNKTYTYTNFNQSSSWINLVYGKTWQVGIFGGYLKNLGTDKNLLPTDNNDFTVYSSGYFSGNQHLDQLFRIAPHLSYNIKNIRLGLEYDLTNAGYGKLNTQGKVTDPYSISNHRVVGVAVYNF
ncbi:MAG: outer membrane protein [Bacteroidetes bacterium]|nr:outer membrane protein [Bacteroidota bacterium]